MAVDYTKFSKYYISQNGEVIIGPRGRIKACVDSDGYLVFKAYDDYGKPHTVKVHRLVATRYIKNNNFELTINHKDGNKKNNSVENLEWISLSKNVSHAWKVLGRSHFEKPVENEDGEVFESATKAAQKYKTSVQAISNCCNGVSKTSCGKKWRYCNG